MKTIALWQDPPGLCEEVPVLDVYVPENKTSPISVVIFPGGAYRCRAPHEGEGYAAFLNSHGITAFVCQYRVAPHRFPLPLLDARRAIRYVRSHAAEYGVDPEQIYVMGSSAGGHLAALSSTYFDPIEFEGVDEMDAVSCIPNGQILCYPVIKLLGKGVANLGSGKNLLDDLQVEMGEALSPDLIANEKTPKAFIWHTFEDPAVNVINSLDYARKLRTLEIPTEMHVYPYGWHGMGLAEDYPRACEWSGNLLRWLEMNEK